MFNYEPYSEIPDHLGSSSWISYTNGDGIQHFQPACRSINVGRYMPYGEDYIDQRNHSWNTPYTFSAKEKDMETGYSYFGARYYMPEISIWASVDPMSDARQGLSPYNYCQWNPVMRVDPTGALDKKPKKMKNHWWQFWRKGHVRTGKVNVESASDYKSGPPKGFTKWFKLSNDWRRKRSRRRGRGPNTFNYSVGWQKREISWYTERFRIVQRGSDLNGRTLNYTSNNIYILDINFTPPGSIVSGFYTPAGQPRRIIDLYNDVVNGIGVNAVGNPASGVQQSGGAGDQYSITFPPGVRYNWRARELVRRQRTLKIGYIRVYQH